MMRDKEDDYKFLPLADAIAAVNQRVNLFAAVIESTLPKQSNGTDCFVTLKIVDESLPSPGINVNVFAANMESLPKFESVGDIIQLSQVVMKTFGEEVYALFNKRFSSFALYEGKHGTSFVPYQVSPKLHARDEDQTFIDGLRKWLIEHKFDTGPDNSLPLKEIREDELCNLVCKVLHIHEVSKDGRMLFVWDGSDTPPVPLCMKLEDEMKNPVPLQLEQFALSRDVLCGFPVVGTILRVIAGEANDKLVGLQLLRTGSWVKFINIKCEVHAGLWRGMLMPSSRLRYLPDDENIVLTCKRSNDERRESKFGKMPFFSFPWPSHVTETDYEYVPFVTLMDMISYRKEIFFGGYLSVERMTTQRNMLLGMTSSDGDVPRSPPWVQVCLKSYYVDKTDP